MLKQENKKGSAKELPVFLFKMADCVRRGGSRRGRGLGFGRRGWLVFRGWWSGSWGLLSVLEAADEVGYFCIVEGAGCLLVEGSELVGDVLDAFVLEPAGYAVEGAVAVAGCVVVLHVGLNGFVELGSSFLRVGGLAVLFFLLAFFCCVIVGFPVEELVAVELDDLGLGVAPVDSCDVAALDVGAVMVNDCFHHGSVVVCAKGYGFFGGKDDAEAF